MAFPLWLLGCLISMGGSIGAIVGTTIQKISFRRNDALPLPQRRVYWRQSWWLCGLVLVGVGGVTDFVSLGMAPQSTIAALGSLPLAANVLLAHFWLGEKVTKRDLFGTALIVAGSTVSVVFGDHNDEKYTSRHLQRLYQQRMYIIYGSLLLGALVSMWALCRFKLTPLRVRLVEAIDAYNLIKVEEDMQSLADEQIAGGQQDWAAMEAEAAAALLASHDAHAGGATSPLHARIVSDAAEEAKLVDGVTRLVESAPSQPLLAGCQNGDSSGDQCALDVPASVAVGLPGSPLPSALDVAHAVGLEDLCLQQHEHPFSDAECLEAPPMSEMLAAARERVVSLESSYLPWLRVHPVFYCALSGIFGAQSLLFGKSVAALLATTMSDHDNQFGNPLTYAFLLALGVCLVGQLHFFAVALEYFDALFVVPVFKCFFLTLSTLGGALYFNEFRDFDHTQWGVFPSGLLINLLGVYVLSTRKMSVQGTGPDSLNKNLASPSAAAADVEEAANEQASEQELAWQLEAAEAIANEQVPEGERCRVAGRRGVKSSADDVLRQCSPRRVHSDEAAAVSSEQRERNVARLQARLLAQASQSLMRSAAALANAEHDSYSSSDEAPTRTISRAAQLANPSLNARLLDSAQHQQQSHNTHQQLQDHERVLLVTSPIAGMVLVASETVGGERTASGMKSPLQLPRSVMASPVTGKSARGSVAASPLPPQSEQLSASLAIDINNAQQRDHANGDGHAQLTPSLYASGAGINVYSLPSSVMHGGGHLAGSSTPFAHRTGVASPASYGAAGSSSSLRRTTSEQVRGEPGDSRAALGSNALPSPPRGSVHPRPAPPTRAQTVSRIPLPPLSKPASRRTTPAIQTDILVQRGNLIYRQPWHSGATPLDSSRGAGASIGGGNLDSNGRSYSAAPSSHHSSNSDPSSEGPGWDALPLYLTPQQSSSFTVSSPLTQQQYSMPREASIFAHTREYMQRLGSATNLFARQGGATPGGDSAGRARSAVSPRHYAQVPLDNSSASPNSSAGVLSGVSHYASAAAGDSVGSGTSSSSGSGGSGAHTKRSSIISDGSSSAQEEEDAWRQAARAVAKVTAAKQMPASTRGTGGASSALGFNATPRSYVPPPFLFQPLGMQLSDAAAAQQPPHVAATESKEDRT